LATSIRTLSSRSTSSTSLRSHDTAPRRLHALRASLRQCSGMSPEHKTRIRRTRSKVLAEAGAEGFGGGSRVSRRGWLRSGEPVGEGPVVVVLNQRRLGRAGAGAFSSACSRVAKFFSTSCTLPSSSVRRWYVLPSASRRLVGVLVVWTNPLSSITTCAPVASRGWSASSQPSSRPSGTWLHQQPAKASVASQSRACRAPCRVHHPVPHATSRTRRPSNIDGSHRSIARRSGWRSGWR
jgi:hypothetical protein